MVVIVNTLNHATFSFYADCRYVSNANVMSLFLSIIGDYDSTMVVMYVIGDGYSIFNSMVLLMDSWFWLYFLLVYLFILYIRTTILLHPDIHSLYPNSHCVISGQPLFYIRKVILYIRIAILLYPNSHYFISGQPLFHIRIIFLYIRIVVRYFQIVVLYIRIVALFYPDSHLFISGQSPFYIRIVALFENSF